MARKGRSGFRTHGARLRRHAGKRHQRQSNHSGACRAGEVPQGTQGLERQVEDHQQVIVEKGCWGRGTRAVTALVPAPTSPQAAQGPYRLHTTMTGGGVRPFPVSFSLSVVTYVSALRPVSGRCLGAKGGKPC